MLIFLIACIVGAVIIFLKYQSDQRQREQQDQQLKNLSNAEKNYREELRKLKLTPTNPDIKEKTLKLGRRFSELTRHFQGIDGVTLVDEVSIMNDINAACAGAIIVPAKAKISTTVEERLVKLSELKEKNLISEEEYETRRQKILDEI